MVHELEGTCKFGVVSDPSGAQEECVSAVAAVKETEIVVVSSHLAQTRGLAETPAGVLCKLTHVPVTVHVTLVGENFEHSIDTR